MENEIAVNEATTQEIVFRNLKNGDRWDITLALGHKLRDLEIAVRHLRVSQWAFPFFVKEWLFVRQEHSLRKKKGQRQHFSL